MKWSPHVCIEKFESLANKMFRSRKDGSSFLCRVQRLALSYLRDCQYSSSPIVDAFASSMDNDELMFNPLSSDTKVAVTTTSVRGSRPYLISNYNGERREGTKGKHVNSARAFHSYSRHKVTISFELLPRTKMSRSVKRKLASPCSKGSL